MFKRLLIATFLVFAASPAAADQAQDFIMERLTEQYRGFLRQVAGDTAREAKIRALYQSAARKVQSKPGRGGAGDAIAAAEEMQKVTQQ